MNADRREKLAFDSQQQSTIVSHDLSSRSNGSQTISENQQSFSRLTPSSQVPNTMRTSCAQGSYRRNGRLPQSQIERERQRIPKK